MTNNHISLRDLTRADRIHFYIWIQDKEAIRYSLSIFQTISSNKEIDLRFRSLLDDKNAVNKWIVLDNYLIGFTGIACINKMYNSGEYFIFIGDRSAWGKGIGSQVTKEIIALAFDTLHLHRLSLSVSAPNVHAVKLYEKAGFIQEWIMRQSCLRDGVYHDKIMMSIIRGDVLKNNIPL